MIDSALLFSLFVAIAAYELYLFTMQRSCLEISRLSNIEQKAGRLMLPLWYASVWPTIAAKYTLAYLIYDEHGFWMAIFSLAVSFVLSVVIPIPHRHFIPIFENVLNKDNSLGNISGRFMLKLALETAKKEIAGSEQG